MIIPLARDCQDVVASSSTASAYEILACKAIADALAVSVYSCTLTTSGKTGADVKQVMGMLAVRGYYVTQSSTTLTIKWDNSVAAVHNT